MTTTTAHPLPPPHAARSVRALLANVPIDAWCHPTFGRALDAARERVQAACDAAAYAELADAIAWLARTAYDASDRAWRRPPMRLDACVAERVARHADVRDVRDALCAAFADGAAGRVADLVRHVPPDWGQSLCREMALARHARGAALRPGDWSCVAPLLRGDRPPGTDLRPAVAALLGDAGDARAALAGLPAIAERAHLRRAEWLPPPREFDSRPRDASPPSWP